MLKEFSKFQNDIRNAGRHMFKGHRGSSHKHNYHISQHPHQIHTSFTNGVLLTETPVTIVREFSHLAVSHLKKMRKIQLIFMLCAIFT